MPISLRSTPSSRISPRLARLGAYATCLTLLTATAGCTTTFWQKVFEPLLPERAPAEPYHTKLKRVNLVIERQEDDGKEGKETRDVKSAKAKPRARKPMPNVPVALRIYPLKRLESFATASAASLRDHDKTVLGADRLGRVDLTLKPGEAVQIPVPMPEGTQYVGVVVFFRDRANAEWQLSVPLSRWENEDPVTLVINGNRLEMASD